MTCQSAAVHHVATHQDTPAADTTHAGAPCAQWDTSTRAADTTHAGAHCQLHCLPSARAAVITAAGAHCTPTPPTAHRAARLAMTAAAGPTLTDLSNEDGTQFTTTGTTCEREKPHNTLLSIFKWLAENYVNRGANEQHV